MNFDDTNDEQKTLKNADTQNVLGIVGNMKHVDGYKKRKCDCD